MNPHCSLHIPFFLVLVEKAAIKTSPTTLPLMIAVGIAVEGEMDTVYPQFCVR